MDTWGWYKRATYDSFKYFLNIVNDYSRGTWTFRFSTKSNAFTIKLFLAMTEPQFNTKVKILGSDNALELQSINESSFFLKSKGIIHQTSYAYFPQQNGVAVWKHRNLLEKLAKLCFFS